MNFDKDGKLTSVEAAGDEETPTIGGQAIQELPAKIVDAGSTDVDGVAGATITSTAIKTAVQEAIDEYNGTSAEIPAAKMKAGTYRHSQRFLLVEGNGSRGHSQRRQD